MTLKDTAISYLKSRYSRPLDKQAEELKQSRALLQEFKHATNYLQTWIEHTIPEWGPEVQRGLEELRTAANKVDNLRQG